MPPENPPPEDPAPSSASRGKAPPSGLRGLEDYQCLFESMSDAFAAIDLTGRFIACNQSFAELVGYSAEEITRMTWRDLTPEEHHEECLARIEQGLDGKGFSSPFQKVYRRKDGTTVPVELRAFPFHDADGRLIAFPAIIRDISAHKSLENHLKEANAELEREIAEQADRLEETRERFRRLSEAAFEGIVVSHEGIILDCNERFASMVGRKMEDLIGSPGLEVVDPSCQDQVINRVMQGNEEPYETKLKRPDGSVFPVEIRARMVQAKDRLIRVSALRDLSEIRHMEQELEQHQHGTDELRRRAASLTPREREVVSLVAQGLLNKEIAAHLNLALVTVKVHRGRAMRKLKAGNAAELGQIAGKVGIVQPG